MEVVDQSRGLREVDIRAPVGWFDVVGELEPLAACDLTVTLVVLRHSPVGQGEIRSGAHVVGGHARILLRDLHEYVGLLMRPAGRDPVALHDEHAGVHIKEGGWERLSEDRPLLLEAILPSVVIGDQG